ncbi:hypothetical protein, partial [Klebsiella pneumoniae]|uniref:hypothetical protein n=1 Tax=Klebsiella pneumoniae TaxID=573 RepID=UPI0013D87A32
MQTASEFAAPLETGATATRSWLATADRALGFIVEIPAAILVVAEVVVLFSGIVARYVLNKP